MPALSLRWDYERRWFVTQGMVLQGLSQAPVFDGECVLSARGVATAIVAATSGTNTLRRILEPDVLLFRGGRYFVAGGSL